MCELVRFLVVLKYFVVYKTQRLMFVSECFSLINNKEWTKQKT